MNLHLSTRATAASPVAPSASTGVLAQHPLLAYFVLAYTTAWLILVPLLLGQNGFGLLPWRLPLVVVVGVASFAPTMAAFAVTAAKSGRAGVRTLLRRYVQGRAGVQWYVLVLLGLPIAFLAAGYLELGSPALDTFVRRLPLFINAYPILIVLQLFTGPLGEEPGWRGFALPRLQVWAGPLAGSLILGLFWALWHVPLYFLPEVVGKYSGLLVFMAFASWVIPFTIIMTWVYNHTRGGLLLMILFHSALNSTVALVVLGALAIPHDLWFQTKIYWVVAFVLLVFTRGKLGYRREVVSSSPEVVGTPPVAVPDMSEA